MKLATLRFGYDRTIVVSAGLLLRATEPVIIFIRFLSLY